MRTAKKAAARVRKAKSTHEMLPRDTNAQEIRFEILSASVPQHILAEVRKRAPKGQVSQYVTRSLERELQRENRLAYIAEAEAIHGPVSAKELAKAVRLLRS